MPFLEPADRPAVRLIAADMDGTLLDSRKRLSPGLFPLIRALTGRGVRFVIASGRQYYNLEKAFREIADRLTFVAENGAVIFEQGRLVYLDDMSAPDVEALAVRSGNGLPEGVLPVLCGTEAAYLPADAPVFVEEQVRLYYERLQRVPALDRVPGRDRICKVTFYVPGAAEAVYPDLKARYPALKVALSGDHWVDVTGPSAHKGEALRFLQRREGLVPDECLAFGDYLNDLEMMEACSLSYGMKNGHPALLDRCRFITQKTNDEDGVCDTLRSLFRLA